MRFAFIATEKAIYPVRVLCRTLEVSRAGFYAFPQRCPFPVHVPALRGKRLQTLAG